MSTASAIPEVSRRVVYDTPPMERKKKNVLEPPVKGAGRGLEVYQESAYYTIDVC